MNMFYCQTRQASDRPEGDDSQNQPPPPDTPSQSSPASGSQNVCTDEPPKSATPSSEGNVFFGNRPRTTDLPGKRRLISKNQMRGKLPSSLNFHPLKFSTHKIYQFSWHIVNTQEVLLMRINVNTIYTQNPSSCKYYIKRNTKLVNLKFRDFCTMNEQYSKQH